MCAVVLDNTGTVLWNSHIDKELEKPAPYTTIPALAPGKLKWSSWPGNLTVSPHFPSSSRNGSLHGDWYRTRFSIAPKAADTVSVNISGFSSGNLFVNGFHLGRFPSRCTVLSYDCMRHVMAVGWWDLENQFVSQIVSHSNNTPWPWTNRILHDGSRRLQQMQYR